MKLSRKLFKTKVYNLHDVRLTTEESSQDQADVISHDKGQRDRIEKLEDALQAIAALYKEKHSDALEEWRDAGTEAFEDTVYCEASTLSKPVNIALTALEKSDD